MQQHRDLPDYPRLLGIDPQDGVLAGESGLVALAVEAPIYSIRVPLRASLDLCGICQGRFLAAGPTGHRDDEVICDLCLLESDPQLGMVLALVAVSRSYGRLWPRDQGEEIQARMELMAFARVFENHAARFAPPRPVCPEVDRAAE